MKFAPAHPWDKNKNVAGIGHPFIVGWSGVVQAPVLDKSEYRVFQHSSRVLEFVAFSSEKDEPIEMTNTDYYGFLQISPQAEPETISRVFHFLASRYHPDNPTTGNAEKFMQLKQAYDVLSDPVRRAEYDGAREVAHETVPLSTSIDFMDNIEGELNRRLAVLALLYIQRRTTPYAPEVPLSKVERRMGFPRDYLDFTTWYLQKKSYIARADNSDFTLTVAGVDYVESNRMSLPTLNKLLTSGEEPFSPDAATASAVFAPCPVPDDSFPAPAPADTKGKRGTKKDRRVGAPDSRSVPAERRSRQS
jgi:curved DNA-binding protein CbpA